MKTTLLRVCVLLLLAALSWKPIAAAAARFKQNTTVQANSLALKIPFPWTITDQDGSSVAVERFTTLWPTWNAVYANALIRPLPDQARDQPDDAWLAARQKNLATQGFQHAKPSSYGQGTVLCIEAARVHETAAFCRFGTRLQLTYAGPADLVRDAASLLVEKR